VAQKKLDQEQSRLQPWSHGRSAIPGFSKLERRRHRVLNALFLSLEAAGFPVTEHQNRDLQVKLGGKQVSFRLREKQRRVQRPLTADERRWSFNKGRETRIETLGSGFLIFEVQTFLPDGMKRVWLETEDIPMEELVGDIFSTFQAAAPLLDAQRIREQAEAVRRQAEEDRRRQIERQRKIDGNRIRLFSNFAKQLQTVRQMRELLSELRSTVTDPTVEIAGRTVADWIMWIEGQIDVRDPVRVGITGVLQDLSAVTEWWKDE
jgi:hypothetical protein